MDQEAVGLPPQFWSVPVVAEALATCDVVTLLQEIRRAHGWTQTELATAVGYTQSWASKVLRREIALTIDQVRDISRRLGIPAQLLRFGESGGGPTNRREFGKAAAMALLPAPRTSLGADENTAAALTAITGHQRRLDATNASRDLIKGVTAHFDLAKTVYRRAGDGSPFATGVAAAVSEAAGFAAWLSMDMHNVGSSRDYYRQAIKFAKRSGNDLLVAYMIGSLATFEINADDPALGFAMIREARDHAGGGLPPIPAAWLSALEAVAHASGPRSDEQAATDALRRAEKAIDDTDGTPPPWPWVFPFDHAKLARYRASVAVRLRQPQAALVAFTESLPTVQAAPKQRAMNMFEVATAICQAGSLSRDPARIDEGFALGLKALGIGRTYSSEQVNQRARAFRREYSGPPTRRVREFDDQLRATLF